MNRHFEQFVNAKNVDIADETLSASFMDHDGPGGKPIDRAGDKAMMRGMHARFPDLHVTIEDMIAEGDKVVCRNVWRATDGDKKIQFKGIVICGSRMDRSSRAGQASTRRGNALPGSSQRHCFHTFSQKKVISFGKPREGYRLARASSAAASGAPRANRGARCLALDRKAP